MPDIIAWNKQTGKSFTAFTGTEADCLEKMVCLKLEQATGRVQAGIRWRDYEFTVNPPLPGLDDPKHFNPPPAKRHAGMEL